MAKFKHFTLLIFLMLLFISCKAQDKPERPGSIAFNDTLSAIKTGASQWETYLPLIINKKIGVVANQTSLVNGIHLVDFLISKGVKIEKVFAAEHGFRGEAGPGDKINSGVDVVTDLPVISLYGSRRKPDHADINGLEYVIYDIQDVGARFYTYISTLHYVMEACAEKKIPVMVLDRPNPNGFYIDGPVLDTAYRSFVGIAPIPIVHGLTSGEFALMTNGEGWLKNKVKCKLKIIEMPGYNHSLTYELPVKPSPNLPNAASIYLYPSLCLFEGAAVSVGRGTEYPFQLMGFPDFINGSYVFTPREIPGIIKDPPYEDQECKGILLTNKWQQLVNKKQLQIEWLVDMYTAYPDKEKFFNNFFDKLAGTDRLRKQIIAGKSAETITKSWQPELDKYKKLRMKYRLYPD